MHRRLFGLLLLAAVAAAGAQEKVPVPHTVMLRRGAPSMAPAQVRACLDLAQRISQLADHAAIAKARDDVETFNATVTPYNQAKDDWNAGCVTPYDPAEMIRAENERGVRFCTFTRTPCLTEAQRTAILTRERARQDAAPRARITRGTAIAHKTTAAVGTPRPVEAAPSEDTSMYAWWLTRDVPALDTTYRDLPSRSLNVPLQRVSLLNCEPSSSQFTPAQCDEIAANGGVFNMVADLDGDGIEERLETAVGKALDGRQVAVLIVSNPGDAREHQLFLQDGPGFSALFHTGKRVSWFNCMHCGHGFEITKDSLTHTIKLIGDGYSDEPETGPRMAGLAPAALDMDAEASWDLSQKAGIVALDAVKRRFGQEQLADAKVDEAVAYQKDIYQAEVVRLVRSALPRAGSTITAAVSLRIIHSQEVGLSEAIETVCVPDLMKGALDAAGSERCDSATREGFINAYQRRQRLEAR